MLRFNLDKQVQLSFYDQIKGQLLSAIYCGKIHGGDRLPAMRELSEDLGVNYKTVRKIYLRLAEENLVEIVRGSGAFLSKREPDTYQKMRRRAIFRQLEEVAEKARGLGLSTRKFARLLDSFATGNNLRPLKLAVVDHEEEAVVFSRELAERTGAEVEPVPLGDANDPELLEKLKAADFLVTTSWHLKDVEELAQPLQKEVVELKPSHQIYTEILEAARHKNIAIVIRDAKTMHASWEVFMNIFHPTTEKKFWIAPIDREDLIQKIIAEADLIFVSPMCWDEMRKRTPAEKELRTYDRFISGETIRQLRELQLLG